MEVVTSSQMSYLKQVKNLRPKANRLKKTVSKDAGQAER